ncbi:MAG: beta-galactosidase, partial [Anaerohalosphaeraceae bacterium]
IEREKGKAIGDPWCLGFFVDNELSWGDETSLGLATLTSPADQPAKKAFIEWLKKKYTTIDKLNSSWAGTYVSWQDISESQKQPDKNKAQSDLKDFYTVLAEKYFELISSELKAAAPNQLYLGCRFAWANDLAVKAAAKYCDVVSFNRYEYSVAELDLPAGIDKPVIIGEFHFGALDHGMFHTGLKETRDQNDRAQKYKDYVQGALRNPYIVGTHWFQYRDQATTGRGDGENYQIGLVDICDMPYPETVSAVKEIGQQMYDYRYNANQTR